MKSGNALAKGRLKVQGPEAPPTKNLWGFLEVHLKMTPPQALFLYTLLSHSSQNAIRMYAVETRKHITTIVKMRKTG